MQLATHIHNCTPTNIHSRIQACQIPRLNMTKQTNNPPNTCSMQPNRAESSASLKRHRVQGPKGGGRPVHHQPALAPGSPQTPHSASGYARASCRPRTVNALTLSDSSRHGVPGNFLVGHAASEHAQKDKGQSGIPLCTYNLTGCWAKMAASKPSLLYSINRTWDMAPHSRPVRALLDAVSKDRAFNRTLCNPSAGQCLMAVQGPATRCVGLC